MRHFLWILLLPFLTPSITHAQIADTLITWRTYTQESQARMHLYESGNEARPLTAVIDDSAANSSGPATDDARFLAETIGRQIGRDPVEITFVFRFTAASFCEGAPAGPRQLLVRATFSRTQTGALASPTWRIISRDELARLTDRALY